jgi:hypothetical protein
MTTTAHSPEESAGEGAHEMERLIELLDMRLGGAVVTQFG